MLTDWRTGLAILLVTSFNALAYNLIHYRMIAVGTLLFRGLLLLSCSPTSSVQQFWHMLLAGLPACRLKACTSTRLDRNLCCCGCRSHLLSPLQ